MANLVTERALDNLFIELMMVVGIFERRHGITGSDVAEVLNQKRREVLERVGHTSAFKNSMAPWKAEHEDLLLSCFMDGYSLEKLSRTLGRSESSLRGKLDNLKFHAIINSYDEIIMSLAKEVVAGFKHCCDEVGADCEVDESWLIDWADEFWIDKAHEYLKEKVKNKREVA